MNFLAHAHVALAGGRDDAGYVLGAVLPDLAPMAGVRIDRGALAPPIADGVRCHVTTDAVFHAHPAFLDGSRGLRRALEAQGVASGPARAVGHAGWELLLDGTLVGSPSEHAFRTAMARGGDATTAMSAVDADRWTVFVARGRAPAPLRYDDPAWVADRLFAMLARRPRLRLPEGQVATVAEVLAGEIRAVRDVAETVLTDTARGAHAG